MDHPTSLTAQIMRRALTRLDEKSTHPFKLIIGGGGAMILAHGFPLATSDIDAVPQGLELYELDLIVKEIAQELSLPTDWLNPYFGTFVHTLPVDYVLRLKSVFSGKFLTALALGREEMLIMKCFAHRPKDVGHAKALIKAGADVPFVSRHIEALKERGIPGSGQALDFLDDIQDQL